MSKVEALHKENEKLKDQLMHAKRRQDCALLEQEIERLKQTRLEEERLRAEEEQRRRDEAELAELEIQLQAEELDIELLEEEKAIRKEERRLQREARRKQDLEDIKVLKERVEIKHMQKEMNVKKKLQQEIAGIDKGIAAMNTELDIDPPDWSVPWGEPLTAWVTDFTITAPGFALKVASRKKANIELKKQPFAKGAFRFAYFGKVDGQKLVFKELIYGRSLELDHDEHKEMARLHLIAQHYAGLFNSKKPADAPSLNYSTPRIFEFLFDDKPAVMFGEELLPDHHFVKYNNNGGTTSEASAHPIPQSFSHFTYDESARKLLICDIQGCFQGSKYYLTDPACHKPGSEGKEFGPSNNGSNGVKNFFDFHECNSFCKSLGLLK